jgi:hypothetical protein
MRGIERDSERQGGRGSERERYSATIERDKERERGRKRFTERRGSEIHRKGLRWS